MHNFWRCSNDITGTFEDFAVETIAKLNSNAIPFSGNLADQSNEISDPLELYDFEHFELMDTDALVNELGNTTEKPKADESMEIEDPKNSSWAEDSDQMSFNAYTYDEITETEKAIQESSPAAEKTETVKAVTKESEKDMEHVTASQNTLESNVGTQVQPGAPAAVTTDPFPPFPQPALGVGRFAQDGPSQSKRSKLDFGKAANKAASKAFAILFVHLGQESKAPISEDLWKKVFTAFYLKTQLAVRRTVGPRV